MLDMCEDSRRAWGCSSLSEVAAVSTVRGVLEDETKSESESDPESESESNERERAGGRAGIDMVYTVEYRVEYSARIQR